MDLRERWRYWLVALTTLLLLGGSFFIYYFINRSVEESLGLELERIASEIEALTREKMTNTVAMLYDLRGLVVAGDMNSKRWNDYLLGNDLEHRYPGVFSLAYVERVLRDDISDFEKLLRDSEGEKYADYSVFPKADNAEYFPVKYLYTTDPDVAMFLGFDFRYSERSIATFTTAVLTDQPTVSELTRLDIIIPQSKKVGYEIVLPVYSINAIKEFTLEERRKFFVGFVGAWVEPESLGVSGLDLTGIRYKLFDNGEEVLSINNGEEEQEPLKSVSHEFDLLNRRFRLEVSSDKDLRLSPYEESLPAIAIAGMMLINVLWFFSVYSALSSRKQSIRLADLATKDLKKFKQAVDGVSDHVIMTDPEGVIVYANKAVSDITGYSKSEIIGSRPSLWGGQMPEEWYQKFWKTIKVDKKPFWGEVTNRRKNGDLYVAEMRVSPIVDEQGNLLFFVGIEKDMSKLRAIEKMKTEFISLASHQLRTPLSAVKWFSEMLLEGDAGKLTKQQMEYVSKINTSNEKEIDLVNALLNVSRIEEGKIIINPKSTNLTDLIESIISEIRVNLAGDKTIKYSVVKGLPEIEIDADLIRHVYINLISNAVYYTKAKGMVEIRVHKKDTKLISEITDNGIGIPKKEQERVFEKFFRASNAFKRVTEGTGLGLYLSKIIVESSGGKIWFTSKEGEGSTFAFSLPLKTTKNPAK